MSNNFNLIEYLSDGLIGGINNYSVTTSVNGYGVVSKSPLKNRYWSGEYVTLVASPYTDSRFAYWSGDIFGYDATVSIRVGTNINVIANFTTEIILYIDEYFPELNYWFKRYWENRDEITLYPPALPEEGIDPTPYINNNFFRLMFDNTSWTDSSYYTYLFKSKHINQLSQNEQTRLRYKAKNTICFVSSEDISGVADFFDIDSTENYREDLLDRLFEYRVSGISDLSGISYLDLSSDTLARNIYKYLDLQLNDNYSYIEDEGVITDSSSDVLDILFEYYYVNEAHKYLEVKDTVLDSTVEENMPCRTIVEFSDETTYTYAIIDNRMPIDVSQLYVFLNSYWVSNDYYYVTFDISSLIGEYDSSNYDNSSPFAIVWDSSQLIVDQGDVIVVDYYTQIF